jgi:hypothetical protein
MSPFGDDAPEMPRNQPFDDDAIEALLAGDTPEGLLDLTAFVADVRMSAEAVPIPSPALTAALASGLSIDKGDLPATAASNVHGPAPQAAGLPKWGRLRMKIQGFLAGLGVAGKVALGVSLAAAATTGAGAAGVLPKPVQHVVASTVGAITPFEFPDGGSGGGSLDSAGGLPPTTTSEVTSTTEVTTTTEPHETTTSAPHAHDGDGGVIAPTPTTEHLGDGPGPTEPTTPATEPAGDGGGATEPTTTPTTEHHDPTTTTTAPHDGDANNPQSLSIECVRATEPNRITCHWTASTSPDHAKYVLLRITSVDGPGVVPFQSPDALEFTDTTVTAGTGYGYRVISLRADGSVESHSNVATIMCCTG